ncbi:MAG: hypothetical protein Q4A48_04870, partial [Bacillota bacterium]|nr:hypothetical protein [Bacillota bacterium]
MKRWLRYVTITMLSVALTFTMIPVTGGGAYADSAEDPDSVPTSEAECESVPTDRYITPDMIPGSEPVQSDSAKSGAKSGTKSGEKSIKTIPTAVVVIGFNNMPYSNDYDWYKKLFDPMNSRSLRQYFTDMSYGQVAFVPVSETSRGGEGGNTTNTCDKVNDGIIHVNVDKDHKDWYTTDIDNIDNGKIMLRSFVQAANKAKNYVDVSDLDANGNGYLDEEELALVFIVAGYDYGSTEKKKDSDLYIRNHKSSIASLINKYSMASELALPRWNDKKLNPYVAISEKCETGTDVVQGRMSSLAHELGHHLGLKDLYDTGSETGPWKNYKVYRMSVMANGSWAKDSSGEYCPTSFDPWSRIKLGWTEPSTIQTGFNGLAAQDFDDPTIKNNILKVPKKSIYPYETGENKGEYYLIEVRRAEKWDEGISTNSTNWKTIDEKGGLVFWHIDDKVLAEYGGTKKINTSEHRPGVMPLY